MKPKRGLATLVVALNLNVTIKKVTITESVSGNFVGLISIENCKTDKEIKNQIALCINEYMRKKVDNYSFIAFLPQCQ